MMVKSLLYLNGKWMPLSQGKISVLDRGFLFADGIYEVIAVYGQTPFDLKSHLSRFYKNIRTLKIPFPKNRQWVEKIILALISKSHLKEGTIYLELTRGPAPRNHVFPGKVNPTFMAFAKEKKLGAIWHQPRGARVISIPDVRGGSGHKPR